LRIYPRRLKRSPFKTSSYIEKKEMLPEFEIKEILVVGEGSDML